MAAPEKGPAGRFRIQQISVSSDSRQVTDIAECIPGGLVSLLAEAGVEVTSVDGISVTCQGISVILDLISNLYIRSINSEAIQ